MRRTDIGYALSGLIGIGITAVGTRFLVSPAKAAAAYGISVGQDVSDTAPTCPRRASATWPPA
jgi:hypothetical protein